MHVHNDTSELKRCWLRASMTTEEAAVPFTKAPESLVIYVRVHGALARLLFNTLHQLTTRHMCVPGRASQEGLR